MPHIEKHPPGAFCWVELATTDQDAAKGFYAGLFGWEANDYPMGSDDFYSMFQLEGRNTAAAYTLRMEQRMEGIPPHWMLFISVGSADTAADQATRLGGSVLAAPFDVYDVGRMSVLRDPTGAAISVWEAKQHQGIGIAGVSGSLCWADLNTPDPERAGAFYSKLFGWKLVKGEKDASGYLHIVNGETFIGGVPPATHHDPHMPSNWLPYFAVTDCDAAASKARQLGAAFHVRPTTFENAGRTAVLADPQGAAFAIFQAARHR